MRNVEQIESALQDFLAPRLAEGDGLEPETDLLESGALDSLLMMELVTFIERKHGVRLDNADLAPRNFRTISAVARMVATKAEPDSPS